MYDFGVCFLCGVVCELVVVFFVDWIVEGSVGVWELVVVIMIG